MKKTKKSAVAEGLSIKNKGDDRGDFVTIKRKAKRKDGSPNKAPDIMDNMKRPLQNTLIGNGSTVNVLFKTYTSGLISQQTEVVRVLTYKQFR